MKFILSLFTLILVASFTFSSWSQDRETPRPEEREERSEQREEADRESREQERHARERHLEHRERAEHADRERREHAERERREHEEREHQRREHGEVNPEARIRHLFEAAEHLQMAGLEGEARRFREQAEHMKRELHRHHEEQRADDIHRQIRQLQEVVRELQRQNAELMKRVNE